MKKYTFDTAVERAEQLENANKLTESAAKKIIEKTINYDRDAVKDYISSIHAGLIHYQKKDSLRIIGKLK